MMKRLFALLVLLAGPAIAQQHLNLTNAPEPSDDSCDLAVFSTADNDIAFTVDNTNICYDTTLNDFELRDGLPTLDNVWIGVSASGGRIVFNDEATDKLTVSNANFGVGTDAIQLFEVEGATTVAVFRDTDSAPIVQLESGAALPAADTAVGVLQFRGEDSGAAVTNYARIRGLVTDDTDTSEDGYLTISTVVAGTLAERLRIANPTITDGQFCQAGTNNTFDCDVAQNAGTDITADMEEESHGSEHNEGGTDEVTVEALGTACTDGQTFDANATTGVDCVTVGGDVTGALDALAVGNDSHDHTTTTVSGLDVSDDTNLAVSAPVTLTGDTVGFDTSANVAITGDWDFGGGGIEIENGTTPPACTVGQLYLDTDATSGQQLMGCEGGTFVTQGDGGGAEVNDLTASVTWDNIALAASASVELDYTGGTTQVVDLVTDAGIQIDLDENNDSSDTFLIRSGANANLLRVNETAAVEVTVGIDTFGATDMDYGSADVTDHTFITDGTGTAEVVLPAGSIDSTEILDGTVDVSTDTNLTVSSPITLTGDDIGFDTTANVAITGDWDFGGGGIEIENGTTPPACTVGQLYLDTDATSGQQLYACEGGTFVLQGDGGGAEVNDLTASVTWANVPDANVSGANERDEVCGTTDLDASCEINADVIDFADILQSNTLAGDPALAVDECFPFATTTGGGFICEGSTANTNEQAYLFPDVDGADTTNRIVVDNTEVTSIDGTGLTISGGVLSADLGTDIDLTTEVTGTLPVANGGTGATTLTDGGILLGSGTGAITALGVATNGQIPIGDGTLDPVLATISGTTNEVDVTNGAGTITLALAAVLDLGGNTSFEIPNSATPTVDAAGEIAVDTTITSHDGLIKYHDGTTEMVVVAIPVADLTTTDGHVAAYDTGAAGFTMEAQAGGGGDTNSVAVREFPAARLAPLEPGDNISTLSKDTGTNFDVLVRSFDDSTDECATGNFMVPPDVQSGSTITFNLFFYPTTASTNSVYWDFKHLAVDDGESWDQASTTEADGGCAGKTTQDQISHCTWTETLANTGWAASDLVEFMVCRDADNVSDNLTGDANLVLFSVEIPRA